MMIQYISTIKLLFSNFIYILLFCYLYHPIYNSCNVKKMIKKNGKTKIVSQPKSILALIYLILLYVLFRCFTFKIILFILISLVIGSLFLFDRLSPKLNDSLYKLNKSPIMITIWKLIHTVFTLIYVISQPLFSLINCYIYNKINYTKNIITQIANLNMLEGSDNIIGNELFKINEEVSNMSDYIFKSQNTKNSKSVQISDIDSRDILKSLSESSSPYNSDETESENKTQETSIITSKSEMIKKIDEINNVINKSSTNVIEDITITITEN